MIRGFFNSMIVGMLIKGQQGQKYNSTAVTTAPPNCDDKNGMAVTQMRHLLQRERNLVSELQVRKPICILKSF